MPLLDLSQITIALRRLLEWNIPLLEPALAGSLTVSTLPPQNMQGGTSVLSLYCYHVSPDPSNRFRPAQVSGPRPIATSPLTLRLYYILTAHTFTGSEFNALAEQRLLGHAMKTIHDHAVLDDTTRIAGEIVLPDEIRGQDNRFSVTQLMLTPGEALNYWTNESRNSVKPSCYYEVTPVEISPDPPDRLPGIVLEIGHFILPKSTPAIARSSSDLPFVRPASLGGGAAQLTASPARVGPVLAPPPPANRLQLEGQGFAEGTGRRLVIGHPFWARWFPGGRVTLDPQLNAPLGWALDVRPDRVTIEAGDLLRAVPPDGGAPIDLELYPGNYTLQWEVLRNFPSGSGTHILPERSNSVAMQVYPRITGFLRDAASGEVTLNLGGAWLLTRGRPAPSDPTTAPELDIQLAVDGRAWRLVNGPAPDGPGTFVITDHGLTYTPDPEADTAGEHAIRLIVDGADSQPFWVEVP